MPASVSPVTSVPCEPPSIKERLRVLYVTYLNISTSVFCARAFCSTCGGEQGQAVIDQRRVVSHGGRARISVALSVTSHSCHLRHQGERQDCHKSTLCWTLVLLWQQLARLGWIEVTRSTLCLSLVTLQALGHHNAQQTSAIPLHYVKLQFFGRPRERSFVFVTHAHIECRQSHSKILLYTTTASDNWNSVSLSARRSHVYAKCALTPTCFLRWGIRCYPIWYSEWLIFAHHTIIKFLFDEFYTLSWKRMIC